LYRWTIKDLGQVAVMGPIPGPVRQMCARADGATPSALGRALPSLDVVDVMLGDCELGRCQSNGC
jgi:hypothetical protein